MYSLQISKENVTRITVDSVSRVTIDNVLRMMFDMHESYRCQKLGWGRGARVI